MQIKKTLRVYFENQVSASYAAEKTGINIKTVCKYFYEFAEQIGESETRDFLERQKRDRSQIIISYDHQIIEAIESISEVKEEIARFQQEKKPIPRHLFGYKIEFLKFKSDLIERKNAFVMHPTMDEAIEKRIQEKVREHGQSRPRN